MIKDDLNDSKVFTGVVEEYINPDTEDAKSRSRDLAEIRTTDASEFMRKAGAGFVSEQYHDIKNTNNRINVLEKLMMDKAGKSDSSLDTITEVYKQLTKKTDNQAKNVLRLYQGNNVDASPLLKKEVGNENGVSKVARESSAEELQTMSALAAAVQYMAKVQAESVPEEE